MLEVMNHKIIRNLRAPMSLNSHNRVEVGLVSLRGDSARAGFLIWGGLGHPSSSTPPSIVYLFISMTFNLNFIRLA